MRFWVIAVVIFSFSMATSIANTMFVDSGVYGLAPRFDAADEVSASVNDTVEDLSTGIGQITSGTGDVWSWIYTASMVIHGIGLFVGTIGNATVFLPFLLTHFYVPPVLAWGISAIVWLIYGMAIVQFFTGKQGKGMH